MDSIRGTKTILSEGQYYEEKYALRLDIFLKERAEKYWFGAWKLRSQKYRDIRFEKDKILLFEASRLGLLYITPNGEMISAQTAGHSFASPMNGFAGFLREYKEAFVVIITILTVAITLSPTVKNWILTN